MLKYLFYNLPYVWDALPFVLLSIPIIVLFRWLRIRSLRKRAIQTTAWHEVGIGLFLMSIVFFSSITFFPHIMLYYGPPFISIQGYIGIVPENINLIPFRVFQDFYHEVIIDRKIDYLITNILGNIVGFLSFGFFLPLLWERMTFPKTILIAFVFSLFVELNQLPLGRGTDIDDLWINTLGAVFGFLVFLLFQKCLPQFTKKFRIKTNQ